MLELTYAAWLVFCSSFSSPCNSCSCSQLCLYLYFAPTWLYYCCLGLLKDKGVSVCSLNLLCFCWPSFPAFLHSPTISLVLILLFPHPLSKHNDPAMCSWLSLSSFPSNSHSQIACHCRKTAALAPGLRRTVLTALMTRDHKHYFPAAAKSLLTFTRAWLRLTLESAGKRQWLVGFLQEERYYIHSAHVARDIRNRFREKRMEEGWEQRDRKEWREAVDRHRPSWYPWELINTFKTWQYCEARGLLARAQCSKAQGSLIPFSRKRHPAFHLGKQRKACQHEDAYRACSLLLCKCLRSSLPSSFFFYMSAAV